MKTGFTYVCTFFLFVINLTIANAQTIQRDVYFTSSWCPRPEEISVLASHLSLTMNGCCVLKGTPKSTHGVEMDLLVPWKKRMISNFYPGARCDGAVMTVEQEQNPTSFFAERTAADLVIKKQKDADDLKNELWPPTSREFCVDSKIKGDLDKRGISLSECYVLAKTDGRQVISERAKAGGYFVRDFGLWDVNSAGGVEVFGKFVNPEVDADIKYIDLQIAVFNPVGDPLRSEIGNGGVKSVHVTGPISNADGEFSAQWQPIWYNHSASCIKILSLKVEFMNRKIKTFSGSKLTNALYPKFSNQCDVRRTK